MENRVIKILMYRDGLTKAEAYDLLMETREMLYNCNGSTDEAEEIMAEQLGLELDYIFDVL